MDVIKRYTKVDPENDARSFDIKRMEDIYERHHGQPDEPHRHTYYTILLIKSARGQHIVDFKDFELKGYQAFFISPGQVHQIREAEKSHGYALTFSPQFMMQNGIEDCFIDDLHLFHDFELSPPLELSSEEMEVLAGLAEEMITYVQSARKFRYQAVGALLKLFLIQCNNACSLPQEDNTQAVQAAVSLLRDFRGLLKKNYTHWHKVSDYAQALSITPDYLNASVKSLSGRSAKEHIQSQITVAAKRLLMFSGLPAKAIAYELGFSTPAYFSQFFKKCTGQSPSAFKKGV
jgi:AraC-like DNA-binding protein